MSCTFYGPLFSVANILYILDKALNADRPSCAQISPPSIFVDAAKVCDSQFFFARGSFFFKGSVPKALQLATVSESMSCKKISFISYYKQGSNCFLKHLNYKNYKL